jgi:hypothetical protein
VAGKRLTPILDESVDAWASCARDILLQSEHDPLARGNPAWRRVRDTTGEARRELLVEQRLLVRRAASTVSTTLLWLPPPLTFAPGDLPRTARNSARWFRIMKSSGATLFCDDHDAASRYALSRFASRHAVTLYRLIGRGRVRAAMGELRDFLVATGRGVGRDADPERLLLASRAWHRRLARIGALAEPGSPGSAPVDATPFPDVPGGDFAGDGVAARAIRSVPELHQEGERMRHCVASRLREILTGRSYIFSVTVLARPLTVELCQRGGALHLGEVRGLANRIPAPAELEALRPWLARLRVRSA